MPSDLPNKLLGLRDQLSGGVHPGLRPAHAKDVMFLGTFVPWPDAAELTSAPHASRPSTPVTVRFSASSGIPAVADNASEGSSPHGMPTRFHLAAHVHSEIIAHSFNGLRVSVPAGPRFYPRFAAFLAASVRRHRNIEHAIRRSVDPTVDPTDARQKRTFRRDRPAGNPSAEMIVESNPLPTLIRTPSVCCG